MIDSRLTPTYPVGEASEVVKVDAACRHAATDPSEIGEVDDLSKRDAVRCDHLTWR